MGKQNFNGFCESNCTITYDLAWSKELTGTIPSSWSDQKYMAFVSFEYLNLHGTLPNWYKWVWPYQIFLGQSYPGRGQLTGTLPYFNTNSCYVLEEFSVIIINFLVQLIHFQIQ